MLHSLKIILDEWIHLNINIMPQTPLQTPFRCWSVLQNAKHAFKKSVSISSHWGKKTSFKNSICLLHKFLYTSTLLILYFLSFSLRFFSMPVLSTFLIQILFFAKNFFLWTQSDPSLKGSSVFRVLTLLWTCGARQWSQWGYVPHLRDQRRKALEVEG